MSPESPLLWCWRNPSTGAWSLWGNCGNSRLFRDVSEWLAGQTWSLAHLRHPWGGSWPGCSGCAVPGQSSPPPAKREVAPVVMRSWAQRSGLWSFPLFPSQVLQTLAALLPRALVSVPEFKKMTFVGLASPSLCGLENPLMQEAGHTWAHICVLFSLGPQNCDASTSTVFRVWKLLFLIFCPFLRCLWWEGKSHTSYSNKACRSPWLIFDERYKYLMD